MRAHTQEHTTVYVWRSEHKLEGSILSLYYVGPRDRTQVVRLESQLLDSLIQFDGHILPLNSVS